MDKENVGKMWYIYTMEFCLAIKKNEIMSVAGKWMELEIMSSEINQIEKDNVCAFSLMQNLDIKYVCMYI
jgi:adenylate cyclase class IV